MMTLLHDFIHQIKTELKLLDSNKQINPFLVSVEQKIGIKREQIIYYILGILIVYLLFGWNRGFVCNFIGFLIPAYASLLKIGLPVTTNDTKWLIYWIIYALFSFVEYFNYDFYQTLRFYWVGKCIFLIWFMMPGSMGGTNQVYYQLIRRFILNYFKKSENFYNVIAGQSNINNADSYDQHGNPINKEYDLGRDGAFIGYRILIGQFYTSGDMKAPIEALEIKGFHVENVKNEFEFLSKLRSNHYQIAWVISSSIIQSNTFVSTLIDFHSAGGAVFLFADNIPYVSHASEFLNKKFGITLSGNYPGNKTLVFKENGYLQAGRFGQHEIFTGIKNLFEGVTICHPVYSISTNRESMVTVGTATDGNPCIVAFDPPPDSEEGRLCLDCGFTKLFINWNSAGTARFVVNASCWLAKAKKHCNGINKN